MTARFRYRSYSKTIDYYNFSQQKINPKNISPEKFDRAQLIVYSIDLALLIAHSLLLIIHHRYNFFFKMYAINCAQSIVYDQLGRSIVCDQLCVINCARSIVPAINIMYYRLCVINCTRSTVLEPSLVFDQVI
jgi:hypothetical protein